MNMPNYIQVEDDKWIQFSKEDNLVCCDCCLTHKLKFKIVDGKIYIKFKRDERATAGYRRGKEAKDTIKLILKDIKNN